MRREVGGFPILVCNPMELGETRDHGHSRVSIGDGYGDSEGVRGPRGLIVGLKTTYALDRDTRAWNDKADLLCCAA